MRRRLAVSVIPKRIGWVVVQKEAEMRKKTVGSVLREKSPYAEVMAHIGGLVPELLQTTMAGGWSQDVFEEGVTIGYARSWAGDEDCQQQIAAMCERANVHQDHVHVDRGQHLEPPKGQLRPGLSMALKDAREGDTFVAWNLMILAGSLKRAAAVIVQLREMGANLWLLNDGIDTRSPEGRLVANSICTTAVMLGERRRSDTAKGLERAKLKGKVGGRPAALDEDTRAKARLMMSAGVPMVEVARQLQVSRATLYNSGLAAFAVRVPKPRKK